MRVRTVGRLQCALKSNMTANCADDRVIALAVPLHDVCGTAYDVRGHFLGYVEADPCVHARYACPPQSASLPYPSHARLPASPSESTCVSGEAAGTHFAQAQPAITLPSAAI